MLLFSNGSNAEIIHRGKQIKFDAILFGDDLIGPLIGGTKICLTIYHKVAYLNLPEYIDIAIFLAAPRFRDERQWASLNHR
jgi:hypothetical protein